MSFMEKHLMSVHRRALFYEDSGLLADACALVPVDRLTDAVNRCECADDTERDETFLLALLRWFKSEFFRWFEPPLCEQCQQQMSSCGVVAVQPVLPEELAERCELYECCNSDCRRREQVRFPRYNHPRKLLTSRVGRCGEWANCFGLLCRALGWRTRCVDDMQDHVWVEVYSEHHKRWLHCDPCEATLDQPLIYERGWKKRLQYVLAGACDHVADVTFRYSHDFELTTSRRQLIDERHFARILVSINERIQRPLSAAHKQKLAISLVQELAQLLTPSTPTADSHLGRQSGSLAWRLARGETSASSITDGFIYRPCEQELAVGRLQFSYCIADDTYYRGQRHDVVGWRRRLWRTSGNIQRKHEHDWHMVYLCRLQGDSSTADVSWLLDLSQHSVYCGLMKVRCPSTTYHSAVVEWTLRDADCSDKVVHLPADGSEIEVTELCGARRVALTAAMSGGHSECAFQHAQLLRASVNDRSIKLHFSVEFRM